MPLSQEEIDALVKGLVKANKESLKEFYVDRETHYQHHEAIGKFLKTFDSISGIVGRTIVVTIVLGIMGLIALGFWDKMGG